MVDVFRRIFTNTNFPIPIGGFATGLLGEVKRKYASSYKSDHLGARKMLLRSLFPEDDGFALAKHVIQHYKH